MQTQIKKNHSSKHNKKGQAAMEFLMTYGWAILVVLIAVAALYALGIFSGGGGTSCKVGPPFACVDVRINSANAAEDQMVLVGQGVIDAKVDPTVGSQTGDCTLTASTLIGTSATTLLLTCPAAPVKGQTVKGE